MPYTDGPRGRREKKRLEEALKTPDALPVVEMNRQNVFMTYIAMSGDVARTAEECGIDAVALQRMVDEEQWKEKIAPLINIKKNAKPKEMERMVNRTLNFAQIQRARIVLDRAIKKLYDMSDEDLFSYLMRETTTTKGKGDNETTVTEKKLDTRGLTDLISAIEKAHMMSYYALNDTTPDRARRMKEENDDSGPSMQEIHTQIADAMAAANASKSPRALVFDQQLAKSEQRHIEAVLQQELQDEQAK